MGRTLDFFRSSKSNQDWSAILLFAAITITAAAAVSILFSKPMAAAALKRFQLASPSYPVWALHQCVPSMYNFENKVQFANSINASDSDWTSAEGYYSATVNHFPARIITFGNMRSLQFLDSDSAVLEMSSSFQGQTLTSVWEIAKDSEGVLKVERVSEQLRTGKTE